MPKKRVGGLPPVVAVVFLIGVSWVLVVMRSSERGASLQPPSAIVNVVDPMEQESLRLALAALELQIAQEQSPCAFEEDVDFLDEEAEVIKDSDKESCCDLCAGKDWCAAAVVSGPSDEPPRACWLKRSTHKKIVKRGVVACVPKKDFSKGEKAPPESFEKKEEQGCRYEADMDVVPQFGDAEGPVARDVSEEECCALCVADPTCKAAVRSSDGDDPPRACWLKTRTEPLIAKTGVVLCVLTQDKSPPKKNIEEKRSSPIVSSSELASRRDAIREAVRHAWSGYADRAWGADSVSPVSGRPVSSGFDMAVTLVDSLDTLKIVGLEEEFQRARSYVASEEFKNKLRRPRGSASFFETCIRVLGGLLGAYAVSETENEGKPFKDAAVILGDVMYNKLDPATGGAPSSMGAGRFLLRRGGCPSLAHSGTTQVEFLSLSFITGDKKYADRALKFYETIANLPNFQGLYPSCVGAKAGRLTLGAEADSFYEYLIKVDLFTKGHPKAKALYDRSVVAFEEHLVSRTGSYLFIDNLDWRGGAAFKRDQAMEHLACFVPGWLALGGNLKLADDIAETCHAFYSQTPSNIGPERVKRHDLSLKHTDTREYILRPEAAEGWWYLAELGDASKRHKYRTWGWDAFQACDKHLKVKHGHASLRDVLNPRGGHIDKMESFWIAETLKYFYLLQDDNHLLPLDTFVFNTEAHPLRIPPTRRPAGKKETATR